MLQRATLLELDESLKLEALKVVKDEAKSVLSDSHPPPRTTLPRIQLPQFSGRYEDWPPFRDLFTSLITNDQSISDVARLHYLKRA